MLEGEEVRLTLDRDIRATVGNGFTVPSPATEGIALTEGRILEIKYDTALPRALETLVASLGLLPESFSKYRTAIEKA